MSEDLYDRPPRIFSIYPIANFFAIAGFFVHPLLHWWVRSNPSMERAMHGYTSLSADAGHFEMLRFFLVWMAEIVALWLLGAGIALLARIFVHRHRR